jgi:D-glycero-D-manno-heptose 1,7-bisphosphate phosphatase
MKKPAVFIDRDGTINEQMGYVNHISRFVVLPGTAEAIRLLNGRRYWVIILSNQSGVGRGYFPEELVEAVHGHLKAVLEAESAVIDGIFYCPHHPGARCDCRKPDVGMIRQACEQFDIDLASSYVVGDRATDLEMAQRFGLKGILVTTGYGRGEIDYVLPRSMVHPAHIAKDLLDAARWIVGQGEHEPMK